MRPLKITLLGMLLIATSAYAANMAWTFDKSHSKIQFTVTHMKISEVTGEFKDYSGTIKTEGEDFEGAAINLTIDVSSIDTDNEKRDGHLKQEAFFDADKHPKIKFEGKDLKKVKEMDNGQTKYRLVGDLTMRGTTREETFTAIHNGTVKDPFSGSKKSGWKIEGTVNRYDYGLEWDKTTEAGNLIVSKEVDITCDVELHPKK